MPYEERKIVEDKDEESSPKSNGFQHQQSYQSGESGSPVQLMKPGVSSAMEFAASSKRPSPIQEEKIVKQ